MHTCPNPRRPRRLWCPSGHKGQPEPLSEAALSNTGDSAALPQGLLWTVSQDHNNSGALMKCQSLC